MTNGEKRSRTTWVHSAFARRCDEKKLPYPAWLTAYLDERNNVQKSPCLFGLPQLLTAPKDQPVAIVEAPKTAVISTPYFPGFIWLAVGALSYLNAERLAPVRDRKIELFPDLSRDGSAFDRWNRVAGDLLAQVFRLRYRPIWKITPLTTNELRAWTSPISCLTGPGKFKVIGKSNTPINVSDLRP